MKISFTNENVTLIV